MKQKLLISLFVLLAAMTARANVVINEETFPDKNFRNWVLSQDYGADGVLTPSEIASVTLINVSNKSIKSLQGIEYFTALTKLYCFYNQLAALDVSKNTKLETLHCDNNQLTALDVSGCTALINLNCTNNYLTALDVSKNTELGELYCYQNQIKDGAMDALVASLPTIITVNWWEVGVLKVIYNENEGNVMTIDQVAAAKAKGWIPQYYDGNSWQEYAGSEPVSSGIAINETNFPDENFRAWVLSQDFGADGVLTDEEIASITEINVSWGSIESLQGIEYFTAMTYLDCSSNQLTALDVSKNTALKLLKCYGNQLTALDVSKNIELISLDCGLNQLTALDVSKNTKLTYLRCTGYQLTALDVSQNTKLEVLECDRNQLTELDVSQNTKLTYLRCTYNQLMALDVSKNTALEYLDCDNNQLTALDVSGCTELTELLCNVNQLTTLDVSGCTALEYLYCSYNQLTTLDVSKNTALKYLHCYNNQLTALDLSKNPMLRDLGCHENQLTTLDVSGCTALEHLYCYTNQLTALDVSGCTWLISLGCFDNQLTALDVSKNTALIRIECYRNQIKDEAMDALVASLPTREGYMYVIYNENEGNVMTTEQAAAAKAKGWIPRYYDGNSWQEYAGSEPVILDFATLTYRAGGQGTMQMPVKTGDVTLNIIPEENWAVETLTVNGTESLDNLIDGQLTLNVVADTEVRVTFCWANAENLYFEDYATGIATIAGEDVKVYVIDGQLCVEGAAGKTVRLYTVGGALIKTVTPQDSEKVGVFNVPTGTYIVQVGNKAAKISVR